jgi:hypothetical protein
MSDQLRETDRAIVELVNRRLALAARMKRHESNGGIALSPIGLRELERELVGLTKRELARGRR